MVFAGNAAAIQIQTMGYNQQRLRKFSIQQWRFDI